jgi:hypothetical protein
MRHIVVFLMLSCLILPVVSAVTAKAQSCGGNFTSIVDQYKQETRDAELAMLEAKQVLLEKDKELWEDSDVETYLYWSLWVVYNGSMAYVLDGYRSLPSDLHMIEDQGYVVYWPEDPFDGWKPMEVTEDTSSFLPGGLCIQTAPDSYKRERRTFEAFELCIYGPTEEFGMLGSAETREMNDWAIVPNGALYMLGMA